MSELSINEQKREALLQVFDVAMRINLETDMACWIDVAGHVSNVKVSVAKAKKEHFMDKVTNHEMYYHRDYGDPTEANQEFFQWAEETIAALNSVLSKTFTKKFTAYCNLIDMSCNQVFVSEGEAKRWVKRMKRKYDKVHAITGYSEELV